MRITVQERRKSFIKFVVQYFTLDVDIMEINIGIPSQPDLIITHHSNVDISHDKIQAQQELIGLNRAGIYIWNVKFLNKLGIKQSPTVISH